MTGMANGKISLFLRHKNAGERVRANTGNYLKFIQH